MQIDTDKVETVFRKVKQLKEHKELYTLDPKRIPVSIVDLAFVVSDMYDLKISLNEVIFEGDRLRSLVERYNNQHAIIYVKHDLPDEVKRFSATKELMHLVIDEPEDWSTAGVETLSSLFTEMSLANGDDHLADTGAQSEVLAEIAAIETLYPYEFRGQDHIDLANKATSFAKLSLHYDIPRYIVARAHQPWYMKIADTMWAKIGGEGAH